MAMDKTLYVGRPNIGDREFFIDCVRTGWILFFGK